MKLAMISDTHFGDKLCTLVDHEQLTKGPKFEAFAQAAGKDNDYLVLLGDIFDFSICSYEKTYRRARVFFELVKQLEIAKNVIYVPGNHDFDMWQTVQQQINVIRQVRTGKDPKLLRWSVPGLIDERTNRPSRGFQIPGVLDDPIDPDLPPTGELLFLNGITGDDPLTRTNFYVVYPNLYMVTDTESVIITHGHYLEAFWSLSGEWLRKIAEDVLGDADTLEDLVALNIPLCELACSGIGQAGKLTQVVMDIEHEVKRGDYGRVERYIDRLDEAIDDMTKAKLLDPKSWGVELLTDLISNVVKGKLKESMRTMEGTRYDKGFEGREDVMTRFGQFYSASFKEIALLNAGSGYDIGQPRRMIYGHTHLPVKWGHRNARSRVVENGKSVKLYNTGGWLWKESADGARKFSGAEVFVYESATGFGSHRVD